MSDCLIVVMAWSLAGVIITILSLVVNYDTPDRGLWNRVAAVAGILLLTAIGCLVGLNLIGWA